MRYIGDIDPTNPEKLTEFGTGYEMVRPAQRESMPPMMPMPIYVPYYPVVESLPLAKVPITTSPTFSTADNSFISDRTLNNKRSRKATTKLAESKVLEYMKAVNISSRGFNQMAGYDAASLNHSQLRQFKRLR